MIAEPGDEMAAGAGGRGHLRASRADRELVISALKAAFVQGRLDRDEFDLRVGQALGSRTYAELAAVTADLPAGQAAAQPSKPAPARREQPVLRFGPVMTVATALYAGVWAYLLLLSPHGGDNPSAPLLIVGGLVVYMLVLVMAVVSDAQVTAEKRSRGQLPQGPAPGAGGPASPRLPSAGPGGQLPPADHGRQHTAEAARRRRPRPPLPVRGHCAGGALAAGTAPGS